jgi:hypothetical protein
MIRKLKILIITFFLAIAPLFMAAQDGPPPPPGGGVDPGGTGGTPVGGAPIGNGTYILVTLAAAYALRKLYVSRKVTAEE